MLYHTNVVQLKHCFYMTEANEVYLNLVLEYVPETVYRISKHYAKNGQRMPTIFVKLYVYQMCRSLHHIHMKGICHRDIKPQNLLVNTSTHQLKLCDFGSAKVSFLHHASLIGVTSLTRYCKPEQNSLLLIQIAYFQDSPYNDTSCILEIASGRHALCHVRCLPKPASLSTHWACISSRRILPSTKSATEQPVYANPFLMSLGQQFLKLENYRRIFSPWLGLTCHSAGLNERRVEYQLYLLKILSSAWIDIWSYRLHHSDRCLVSRLCHGRIASRTTPLSRWASACIWNQCWPAMNSL